MNSAPNMAPGPLANDGWRPLTPEERLALDNLRVHMETVVIPRVNRRIRERERAAAKIRHVVWG